LKIHLEITGLSPFTFMKNISLEGKTNLWEKRIGN
jgi:hypothetical protein